MCAHHLRLRTGNHSLLLPLNAVCKSHYHTKVQGLQFKLQAPYYFEALVMMKNIKHPSTLEWQVATRKCTAVRSTFELPAHHAVSKNTFGTRHLELEAPTGMYRELSCAQPSADLEIRCVNLQVDQIVNVSTVPRQFKSADAAASIFEAGLGSTKHLLLSRTASCETDYEIQRNVGQLDSVLCAPPGRHASI